MDYDYLDYPYDDYKKRKFTCRYYVAVIIKYLFRTHYTLHLSITVGRGDEADGSLNLEIRHTFRIIINYNINMLFRILIIVLQLNLIKFEHFPTLYHALELAQSLR